MKLTLVRHGETEDNLVDYLTGQQDGILSELGLLQIRCLGESLRDEHFDIIFSSDLGRARQTTESIAQYHSCRMIYSQLLRETSYGEFEGSSIEVWRQARRAAGVERYDYQPPVGESPRQVEVRVRSFLALLANYLHENVLVSAHSDVNRLIIRVLLGVPLEEPKEIPFDNASIFVFKGNSLEELELIVENDSSHWQNEGITKKSSGRVNSPLI